MNPFRSWIGRLLEYLVGGTVVTGATVAVVWPFVGPDGHRGLLLAAAVVLVSQAVAFGAMASTRPGSRGFFGVWIGGTLIRLGMIGVVGFALDGAEGVDPLVALLTMAGLFFVLMLLELWMLRDHEGGSVKRDLRTRRD